MSEFLLHKDVLGEILSHLFGINAPRAEIPEDDYQLIAIHLKCWKTCRRVSKRWREESDNQLTINFDSELILRKLIDGDQLDAFRFFAKRRGFEPFRSEMLYREYAGSCYYQAENSNAYDYILHLGRTEFLKVILERFSEIKCQVPSLWIARGRGILEIIFDNPTIFGVPNTEDIGHSFEIQCTQGETSAMEYLYERFGHLDINQGKAFKFALWADHCEAAALLLKDERVEGTYLHHSIESCRSERMANVLLDSPKIIVDQDRFNYLPHHYGLERILSLPDIKPSDTALQVALIRNFDTNWEIMMRDHRINSIFNDEILVERACEHDGHRLTFLSYLIKTHGIDPSVSNNIALRKAIEVGYEDLVLTLLKHPKMDPIFASNELLKRWCGSAAILKEILQDERVDPSIDDNEPLIHACSFGLREKFNLLLQDKRVNPAARDNEPLIIAAKRGFAVIVETLLNDPRVDPNARKGKALSSSIEHPKVYSILFKDPRVIKQVQNHDQEESIQDNRFSIFDHNWIYNQ